MGNVSRRTRRAGSSVIEVALMAPWILFLFVGIFDFGFAAYALICTENAARVAALYASSSVEASGNSSYACVMALEEMRKLPNLRSVASCGTELQVTATPGTDSDGYANTKVTVAYQMTPLIRIPGILNGPSTISRTVEMRVFGGE